MEIDRKRLIVAFCLVFILGVLFAVVNGKYTSETNQQLPILVYVISLVSVIVGASIVVLFQWKITRLQIEKLLRVLPREERLVVHTLYEHKNELEQNKLVVLTGLSKLQVSRTIQKLHERGVAEKKPLGNTNLIILKL